MSLKSRLARLEKSQGDEFDRCPACRGRPPEIFVTSRADFPGAEPVPEPSEGWEQIHPCKSCGWEPKVIHLIETVVRTRQEAVEIRAMMDAQGGGSG
jgi:hypothetical protein